MDANNSLHSYLVYQWLPLRGSKKGSKGSIFYSSCIWKILWWHLAKVSECSSHPKSCIHCKSPQIFRRITVLAISTRFTGPKADLYQRWQTSCQSRSENCSVRELCNVCNVRLQLAVQGSPPALTPQHSHMGSCDRVFPLTWLSSREVCYPFPGIYAPESQGKRRHWCGISGSTGKSFPTATLTLWVITLCSHHGAICIWQENMLSARDLCHTETKTWIIASTLCIHCEWKHNCSESASICPSPTPQRLLKYSLHCFPHKNNVKNQW